MERTNKHRKTVRPTKAKKNPGGNKRGKTKKPGAVHSESGQVFWQDTRKMIADGKKKKILYLKRVVDENQLPWLYKGPLVGEKHEFKDSRVPCTVQGK